MVANGNIPSSQMVQRQGMWLWPSTAAKFDVMNADLVSKGYPSMIITPPYGAYRSLADQVQVKKLYGAGAATPGYSNHGLGRAWDIDNISRYPAGVIPAAAKRHGLLIDAGNGHGGIESWHMHDADGITPAGSGTLIPTTPDTEVTDMPSYEIVKTANDPAIYFSVDRLFRYHMVDQSQVNDYSSFIQKAATTGRNPMANPNLQIVGRIESFGVIVKDT